MAFNRFAAGNKRYGQASNRPTAGTVDPTGYIKRELARKSNQQGVSRVGNDGKSDTRSGLAHNAIIRNNLGNNIGRTKQTPVKIPGSPSRQVDLPKFRNPSGPPVGNPAVQPAAQPTGVSVGLTGQLQLPYDSAYFGQVLDAQQNFDAEMMNIGFEEQNQSTAYQQFMRELEQGYVDRQRGTLSNSAARGTLRSSQYATGVSNDARDYTNAKTDADTENSNFLNQVATRKTNAQTWFNQAIQQAAQSFAERYAASNAVAAAEQAAVTADRHSTYMANVAAEEAAQRADYEAAQRQNAGNNSGPNKVGNGGGNGNRPPKPGPNYEWNANKGKWVKK